MPRVRSKNSLVPKSAKDVINSKKYKSTSVSRISNITYSSPLEMQNRIDAYFNSKKKERKTLTGLILFLGFSSRQSFYDYEKRTEFKYVIERARMRIENEYETGLRTPFLAGCIFALKHFGTWKEDTTNGSNLPAKIIIEFE